MKRFLIVVLILTAPLVIAFQRTKSGDVIQNDQLTTPMVLWDEIGHIDASNATLAVTARDYSEVWTDLPDANTVTWDVPNEVSGVELRFETTADADATVVEIWLASGATMRDAGEAQFTLGAILTLTGGTQTGTNSNVFVDTIVETASTGIMTDFTVVDSAANRMAIYRGDLRGYKKVVIIATTLESSSDFYAAARWY